MLPKPLWDRCYHYFQSIDEKTSFCNSESPAQGHAAAEWWTQDLNLVLPDLAVRAYMSQ